jgi:hypothetical protein
VVLEGGADFVPENDRAPVATHFAKLTIGVLSDRTLSKVETGGAPLETYRRWERTRHLS